jgi:putative flippase GtrA
VRLRKADGCLSNRSSLLRFIVLGASNTGITLVLFALLARVISPWLAYTVVFTLGLTYTTLLIGRFVFRTHNTLRRSGLFVSWYLAVFAVGLIAVQTLQAIGVHSSNLLAALTVAITAPLNFLGGRLIFQSRWSISAKGSH